MISINRGTGNLVFLLSLTFLVASSLAGPRIAVGAVDIDDCGQAINTSTGNARLTGNITWNGTGTCLQVSNGKHLDFNGFTITCQAGSTCGAAVTCATGDGLHTGSLIEAPTNDDDNTDITGDFVVGIHNCGTVKHMRIVGATTGILFDHASSNAQDTFGNVIHSADGGIGINTKMTDGGDSLSDNLVVGGDVGIFLALGKNGTTAPQVKENILRGYAVAGIQSTITSNDYFRIFRNTMIDGDEDSVPFDVDGANGDYQDNICETDSLNTGRCACEMDEMDGTNADSCPL